VAGVRESRNCSRKTIATPCSLPRRKAGGKPAAYPLAEGREHRRSKSPVILEEGSLGGGSFRGGGYGGYRGGYGAIAEGLAGDVPTYRRLAEAATDGREDSAAPTAAATDTARDVMAGPTVAPPIAVVTDMVADVMADGKLLRAIEDALIRMRHGTYDVCTICAPPLSKARLEAVPWAHVCKNCKEQRG
jgi:hypothetical protein